MNLRLVVIVGLLVATLAIAVATPIAGDNIDAGGVGRAGGTIVQLVAMVVALVAALLAIRQERTDR